MSLLSDAKAQRRSIWEQAQNYLDSVEKSGRSFDADTDQTYKRYTDDLDALDVHIVELDSAEQRNAGADAYRSRFRTPGPQPSTSDTETVDAFRSAILEKNPTPIIVSDPSPRSYYQPGVERRDLLKTAPANFTPIGFHAELVRHLVETSAVLSAGATLLVTGSGEDMRIPRSTANSTAAIVSEAAAIPESDPTLGQVTLGSHKYGFMVQVSHELASDTTVDLQSYLAEQAGTAIAVATGNHFINGTGTGQPRGILTDATVGVTGPTGTSTSFGSQATAGQGTDLLNSLAGSVAEPYTATGANAFLLRNATLTTARNLKASTGELVGNSYIANSPWPFLVDPSVPAQAANARSVIFGDYSRYFVRMVNGIRFERSDDFAWANDLITFRVLLRLDAALIDVSALKFFQNSAT